MTLYMRMLAILLRQLWSKPAANPLTPQFVFFRAWLHDCDFNFHLTSSRYFALMDLARLDLMFNLGMGKLILKHKWKFVINAQEITYVKEIPPFARFCISSQILGWDEKYFYVEHRVTSNGTLHAVAHVRNAALKDNKVISMWKVFETCGFKNVQASVPEAVDIWKQLLTHKKLVNKPD